MSFESIDHTADLKILAKGRTLEQAFQEAARGGIHFLTEEKIRPELSHKISISSRSIESLLYDFLEELLFLIDTKGFLFSGAKGMKILEKGAKGFHLTCTLLGDSFKNYSVKGDLKAVTYNGMNIAKKGAGYEVTVVFDI